MELFHQLSIWLLQYSIPFEGYVAVFPYIIYVCYSSQANSVFGEGVVKFTQVSASTA